MTLNGARHELELRADVARDRLMETVDALDRRRLDAMDWRLQLRRHLVPIALVSAALLGTVALAAGTGAYRAKLLATRRYRERVHAVERFWEHPERVAERRRRPVRVTLLSALVAGLVLATARIVRASPARGTTRQRAGRLLPS